MNSYGSEKCLLTTVSNLTANFIQAVSTRPTVDLRRASSVAVSIGRRSSAICTGTRDKVPAAGEVVPASRPTPLHVVPGRTNRSPGHPSRSRQFLTR